MAASNRVYCLASMYLKSFRSSSTMVDSVRLQDTVRNLEVLSYEIKKVIEITYASVIVAAADELSCSAFRRACGRLPVTVRGILSLMQ